MSIDVRVNQDGGQTIPQEVSTPPAQITVSQIMDDLDNGRDRKAIKAKYGLTMDEVKMIFEHPKLKGMRVKKAKVVRFTLVDDTEVIVPESTSQISLEEVISQASTETAEAISNMKSQELKNNADAELVESLNTNFSNYNDNQTEIQD